MIKILISTAKRDFRAVGWLRKKKPKLLRFIQDRVFERVGDQMTKKADVRIITATNINLETVIKERRFREDPYYRLNGIQIELPPLGVRPEDLETLAKDMLKPLAKPSPVRMLCLSMSWQPKSIREDVIPRARTCPSARIRLWCA